MSKTTNKVLHFASAFTINVAIMAGGVAGNWLAGPDGAFLGCVAGGAVGGLGCGLIAEFKEAGGSNITAAKIKAHFSNRRGDQWWDLVDYKMGGATAGVLVGLVVLWAF